MESVMVARVIVVAGASLWLWAASAAAQTGTPIILPQDRPWLEAAFGLAVGGHTTATSPPVCDEFDVLCRANSSGRALGGMLTFGGRLTSHLTLLAEVSGYTQRWSTLDGIVQRENLRFVMAGPRLYLPLGPPETRLRLLGHALAGAARRELVGVSDPVARRRAVLVGGGVDWRIARDPSAPLIRATIDYRDAGDDTLGLTEWRTTVGLSYNFGTRAPAPPQASRTGLAPVVPPPPPVRGDRFDASFGLTMHTPPDVNAPPRCDQLSLPCTSPRTFPDVGVVASGAIHVVPAMAVVGELSSYGNAWRSTPSTVGAEINHVHALLGGVRLMTPPLWFGGQRPTAIRLFAQVLAGFESSTLTTAHRAWQPGAGVDFDVRVVTFRVQIDYRSVPRADRNLSAGRVLFGIVFAR